MFRNLDDQKKTQNMRFSVEPNEVKEKRESIFQTLKAEGLRKNENDAVKEEDIDKMWNL
jgi:hypothetical protein